MEWKTIQRFDIDKFVESSTKKLTENKLAPKVKLSHQEHNGYSTSNCKTGVEHVLLRYWHLWR